MAETKRPKRPRCKKKKEVGLEGRCRRTRQVKKEKKDWGSCVKRKKVEKRKENLKQNKRKKPTV